MGPTKKRHKIKLDIAYDGSDFNGFQKQKQGPQTVQGALEAALTKLLDEPISVAGAGRTDKGVHALQSHCHFWTTKDPFKYKWTYALNGPLTPDSLVIKNAWLAPDEFHSLSSVKKTYKYVFLNSALPSPLMRLYATYDRRHFDIDLLNLLSSELIGTHDFSSFETSGTESKTPIKTIYKAHWQRQSKDLVVFTITGNGFLKQMVRNIVGTLTWCARNQATPEKIMHILAAKDRQAAKDTAPPQGLYMVKVHYSTEILSKMQRLPS